MTHLFVEYLQSYIQIARYTFPVCWVVRRHMEVLYCDTCLVTLALTALRALSHHAAELILPS